MIEGFQKCLIDNGFKRLTYKPFDKSFTLVENNDSYSVSTSGPTYYVFMKDGKRVLYWGLGVAGRGPYYYYPKKEQNEVIISDDFELEFKKLCQRLES